MLRAAVALLFVGFVFAEIVKFRPCDDVPDTCTIDEFQVTPCDNPALCQLSRTDTMHFSLKFTPKFVAEKMSMGIFVQYRGRMMPYGRQHLGLNADACTYISCPTVVDKTQNLEFTLPPHLTRNLPTGIYPVQVKMWDSDKMSNACCFNININTME